MDSFSPSSPETAVEKIQEVLSTLDIVLSDTEKKKIIIELTNNPEKVRVIFAKMIQDLKTPPR